MCPSYFLALTLLLSLNAFVSTLKYEVGSDAHGYTAPIAVTIKANQAVLNKQLFSDVTYFEDANRGLVTLYLIAITAVITIFTGI